jgi:hypothetical protein
VKPTPEQILEWTRSAPLTPTSHVGIRTQRLALLILATYADDRGHVAGGRVDELQRIIRTDERLERRIMAELERAGVVVVERTGNGRRLGYQLVGLCSSPAFSRAS